MTKESDIQYLRAKFRNDIQELAECIIHEYPKYWYDGGWPELQDLTNKYIDDTRRTRVKYMTKRATNPPSYGILRKNGVYYVYKFIDGKKSFLSTIEVSQGTIENMLWGMDDNGPTLADWYNMLAARKRKLSG